MINKIAIVFLFASSLFAAKIVIEDGTDNFLFFNKNNSKIYTYILLNSGESFKCNTVQIDSLEIYSRLVMNGINAENYQYEISINDEKRVLEKNAIKSKICKGVNGEVISRFNKFKTALLLPKNKIKVKNISEKRVIFKIKNDEIVKSNKKIDFIRFTPNFYGTEKTLFLNEKEFTYYSPKADKIKLTLQGPIVLKIVSRMLFEDNFINKDGYKFNIYDNRELFSEITEIAYKSNKAWIAENQKIPSTGDVNIIKLPKGIHHIEVENRAQNRDLMFRFYINKSSVEIEKQ
ncbi:MAG: hypothetical protein HN952_04840 [Candidatus Cloacimonetes bacterium]|jgi:hypothetical protein|nr:hypothetical protein [Candidatus Cloacimonadota bacterium]MBT6994266.1 hypothetical protein [Candidatus Cloacimonadota bacterium]MBT7469149.1 hypothetical protein [Candidatus Cloacimonadota bacterium]